MQDSLRVTRHRKTKTKTTKIDELPPRSQIMMAVAEAFEPLPDFTVSEFSDRERILPRGASFEAGLWRTSRFPFLREIMDYMGKRTKSKMMVIRKGAQVGVTEAMLNFIFYKIKHKPGPMMYIQKTLDAVSRFLRQRFDKSSAEMPEILKLLKRGKRARKGKKKEGSTQKLKSYPGGIAVFGGANSAASLRSTSIEALLLDEEDSYEADIEEEGSPIDLAIVRARNYPFGKIVRASTPKILGTSTIHPAFLAGDQRFYYVPCPFCKELDYIRFSRIKYENNDPTTAALLCEHCGALIPERYKTWMMSEANGAKWIAHNPGAEYPSWHLPSFYSPLGFYSWEDLVREWLEAQKDFTRVKLKALINTVFGEAYEMTAAQFEEGYFDKRKEVYAAEIPQAARIIVQGFDVQKHKIEGEVLAIGKDMECWSINYVTFTGDTTRPEVWFELEKFITTTSYRHQSGAVMAPAITMMDSGYATETVYTFCKRMELFRVYPLKGNDGWGRSFVERPLKRNKQGVFLYHAFVDGIKAAIYSQLQVDVVGAGYCHFPQKEVYNKQYFGMLVAEVLRNVKKGFKTVMQWELPAGRKNEALDARCYCIVGFHVLGPVMDLVNKGQFFPGLVGQLRKAVTGPSMPGMGNPGLRKKRKVHSRGIG